MLADIVVFDGLDELDALGEAQSIQSRLDGGLELITRYRGRPSRNLDTGRTTYRGMALGLLGLPGPVADGMNGTLPSHHRA